MQKTTNFLFISALLLASSMAFATNTSTTTSSDAKSSTSANTVTTPSNDSNTVKQISNVQGNPVGKRDNYAVGSDKKRDKIINCVFINTGEKPIDLNVWTDPSVTTPAATIQLKPGSATKPTQVMKQFQVKLENHWWCRVSTPASMEKDWGYCAYFSVSDANNTNNNPFQKWDPTIISKDTSYNCRISKPTKNVSFFYYH